MSRPARIDWSSIELGSAPDAVIATQLGVHRVTVTIARRARGIPAWLPLRPWTPDEDAAIELLYENGWTDRGRARLARELDRTPAAIKKRASDLGLPSVTRDDERWPKTLEQLERETGYERCRIEGAARRLGIQLRRGARGARAHFAITEAQAERIFAELRRYLDGRQVRVRHAGEWARGQSCVDCGTTDRQRASRERCTVCYPRWRAAQRAQGAAV